MRKQSKTAYAVSKNLLPACLCYSTTFSRVFQQKLPLITPNKTATLLTKTETNRAFCYLYRTFSHLSAWGWWESGLIRQRRAAILIVRKAAPFNKIPARPRGGRPLTDCALLSLFWGAPKGTEAPKLYRFCYGFSAVAWETVWVLYIRRACYSLP